MAVRREGNGWRVDVCVVAPNGQEVRRKKRCRTKREAEHYERELRASLIGGTYERREEAPLFKSQVAKYFETYAEATNKHSTVQSKRQMFALHLLPALGELRLDRIDVMAIDGLIGALRRKKLKGKTINNVLTTCHHYLARLHRWGLVDQLPDFEWQVEAEPTWRFFSHAELAAVLEHAGEWHSMILCAARTGLRAGELRGLQWGDLDLERRTLTVRRNVVDARLTTPKTGQTRVVPMTVDLVDALRELRHLKAPWVWTSPANTFVAETTQRNGLLRACAASGVRAAGWHVLRHTFASHLAMAGIPLYTIGTLLGHSSVQMTQRYAHLSPGVLSSAVDVLVGAAQERPR